MAAVWEDMVSLNTTSRLDGGVLLPVSSYLSLDDGSVVWDRERFPLDKAIAQDTAVLPDTKYREGYYGDNHYAYWASGLRDCDQILDWCKRHNISVSSALDIGCATGRILRHMHFQMNLPEIYGCDINRLHVDWVNEHLPQSVKVFQNSSMPIFQIPSKSLDFVSAFSVFTHVEAFDTAWIMEIKRVLKPGGVAWITIHGDRTWKELNPSWPIYSPLVSHPDFAGLRQSVELPEGRTVFRWHSEISYSANIFYNYSYIKKVWGRFMDIADIFPALPLYQDIVVMRA